MATSKLLRFLFIIFFVAGLDMGVSSHAQDAAPNYQVAQADFEALQDGISSALSVGKDVFPNGIGSVGIVLYDSANLYIYSHQADLALPKRGSWRNYTIYQIPHNSQVSERAMARCAGGEDFVWKALYNQISTPYFTCSPWTIQGDIQRRRRSIYDTRESYQATVVHEYGHVYMSQELWQIPILQKMIPRVRRIQSRESHASILQEAYAIWCELQVAKKFFPTHYDRLKNDYVSGLDERHNHGLKVALDVMSDAQSISVPFLPKLRLFHLPQAVEINRLFK